MQNAALFVATAPFPLNAPSQDQPKDHDETFDPVKLAIFAGVSPATFEQWIGSRFRVSKKNRTQGSLVLFSVSVIEIPKPRVSTPVTFQTNSVSIFKLVKTPEINTFSLRFRRSGIPLPQDTYMLDHNWLGTFPLFLVPSGLTGQATTCTAIFSLFSQTTAP
jgi:hypothetical protein